MLKRSIADLSDSREVAMLDADVKRRRDESLLESCR